MGSSDLNAMYAAVGPDSGQGKYRSETELRVSPTSGATSIVGRGMIQTAERRFTDFLESIAPQPEWMPEALCTQTDPEIFFPERGEPGTAAYRVCAACPVVEQCREWGIGTYHPYGIVGGLSARQRTRIRQERRAAHQARAAGRVMGGGVHYGPDLTDKYCAAAKLELRIGELASAGMPREQIAHQLGVDRLTVYHAMERMGFELPSVKERRPAQAPIGDHRLCGTDSGYYRHRRRAREAACVACCDAHAEAEARRKQRKQRRVAVAA